MKRMMLILTIVSFYSGVFSSQVDFSQYRQIYFYELEGMDYQVVLRDENNEPILVIIDGEILYIEYLQ